MVLWQLLAVLAGESDALLLHWSDVATPLQVDYPKKKRFEDLIDKEGIGAYFRRPPVSHKSCHYHATDMATLVFLGKEVVRSSASAGGRENCCRGARG